MTERLKLHKDAKIAQVAIRSTEAALLFSGVFLAAHFGIHAYESGFSFLDAHLPFQIPVINGLLEGLHGAVNSIPDHVGQLVEKIPQIGSKANVLPELAMKLPHVSEGLHGVTNQSSAENVKILEVAELAGAPVAVWEGGKYLERRNREGKIKRIAATHRVENGTLEQQAASAVVAELQSRRFQGRRYAGLNVSDVADKIAKKEKEFQHAHTPLTAFLGNAAAEVTTHIPGLGFFSEDFAREALHDEMYATLPGNPVHKILSRALDNGLAQTLFRLPTGGDEVDTGYDVIKAVLPKFDIFGNRRTSAGLVMTGARLVVGGLFPVINSEDIDAFVERTARHALATSPKLHRPLVEASAVVVGEELRRGVHLKVK